MRRSFTATSSSRFSDVGRGPAGPTRKASQGSDARSWKPAGAEAPRGPDIVCRGARLVQAWEAARLATGERRAFEAGQRERGLRHLGRTLRGDATAAAALAVLVLLLLVQSLG